MAIDKNRPTYAVEAIPSDITNSVFLGNPAVDNLLSCVIAMNAEMWATKRRMKVLESLLAKKGITQEMIEGYVPTAAETAEWEKERDRFIELAMGPLANDGFRSIGTGFPQR
ncbi:MAG: hypothetical protein EBZ91_00725 [Gammaproteobacteria bacterium]|jgi:hypothetical protein|nr:hypothetical protein [Gammaproteobacteria bacterium]